FSAFIVVTGGNQNQFIRKNRVADVQFTTDDGDAFLVFVNYTDVEVFMGLLRVFGMQSPVAFGVADRSAQARIVFLAPSPVRFHVFGIMGTHSRIQPFTGIGHAIQTVDTRKTGTTDAV